MLFLADHEYLDLQSRIEEEAGEAHQLREHIVDLAVAGGEATTGHLAVGPDPHDELVGRDRVDDSHPMSGSEEVGELGSHSGEATRLDLDQQVIADDVDDEAVHRDFDLITGLGAPALQRGMERLLAE
jgi:hypothetical protein